jgi:hypothetical protein
MSETFDVGEAVESFCRTKLPAEVADDFAAAAVARVVPAVERFGVTLTGVLSGGTRALVLAGVLAMRPVVVKSFFEPGSWYSPGAFRRELDALHAWTSGAPDVIGATADVMVLEWCEGTHPDVASAGFAGLGRVAAALRAASVAAPQSAMSLRERSQLSKVWVGLHGVPEHRSASIEAAYSRVDDVADGRAGAGVEMVLLHTDLASKNLAFTEDAVGWFDPLPTAGPFQVDLAVLAWTWAEAARSDPWQCWVTACTAGGYDPCVEQSWFEAIAVWFATRPDSLPESLDAARIVP